MKVFPPSHPFNNQGNYKIIIKTDLKKNKNKKNKKIKYINK